jgi:cysteinyl-tRNA synthetase
MKINLYNTSGKIIEEIIPLNEGKIGMYSCGPTVYYYAHIGNLRTYICTDILRRTLEYTGLRVKQVMNVTDVGHMTSDEDAGEDKIEKRAQLENRSPWEIARFYEDYFFTAIDKLNILPPQVKPRGTEHIPDMIQLIERLETKGYTYRTGVGVIFDTAKFPRYPDFAGLKLEGQISGHRVNIDPERRHPWDFALWVTNQPQHLMQWDSPWGKGFPGWHIECSAMSMKYLGEQLDIHTGGIDHIPVHHTNEIAQSEAATGKQFAKYWFHCNFLTVDDRKMSKSLGNLYTLEDLEAKAILPLSFRFFCLYSSYMKSINFTWEALAAAQNSLVKLWTKAKDFPGPSFPIPELLDRFETAMGDNLNTPVALAVLWEVMNSDYPDDQKAATIFKMDEILGLRLRNAEQNLSSLEMLSSKSANRDKAAALAEKRKILRNERKFREADEIRNQIQELGFTVKDTADGFELVPVKKAGK